MLRDYLICSLLFIIVLQFFSCNSSRNKIANNISVDSTINKIKKDTVTIQNSNAIKEIHPFLFRFGLAEKNIRKKLKYKKLVRAEDTANMMILEAPDLEYLSPKEFENLNHLEKLAFIINYPEMYYQNCAMYFLPSDKNLKDRIFIGLPNAHGTRFISEQRMRYIKEHLSYFKPYLDSSLEFLNNESIAEIARLYNFADKNLAIKQLYKLVKSESNGIYSSILLGNIDFNEEEPFLKRFKHDGNPEFLPPNIPFTEANKKSVLQLVTKYHPYLK